MVKILAPHKDKITFFKKEIDKSYDNFINSKDTQIP
jgi:hypothetical protein